MLLYALVPTLPRIDWETPIDSGIEDYIKRSSEIRKSRMQELLDFMRTEYPDLRESLKYKMPTFERNGKSISFANQKNYLSIYFPEESYVRAFRAKASGIASGKTCINLKDKDKVPMVYLKTLLKKALADKSKRN
ncbi:PF08818 domain protein [Leptospira inadai serovar Lyme str. 10]|uniref:PF08818 domain protein n=2 Tax=Leptospira inadai serovar Lyme TaxID=293084 RepID=V6HPZ9_9LEPT|nr:DUF1801 domain-containing protein [Leptospira inadai]EQA38850.1 PF08818 domain protein [Leptospira inadai serovar Lyme str. 10]PNV74115.1 DUF1801 domain-containing protein [Leptospira inadai serovar Lyme]